MAKLDEEMQIQYLLSVYMKLTLKLTDDYLLTEINKKISIDLRLIGKWSTKNSNIKYNLVTIKQYGLEGIMDYFDFWSYEIYNGLYEEDNVVLLKVYNPLNFILSYQNQSIIAELIIGFIGRRKFDRVQIFEFLSKVKPPFNLIKIKKMFLKEL